MNKPQTLEDLKVNIRDEIEKIPKQMLRLVMENARKRANLCFESNGAHLKDVIFLN